MRKIALLTVFILFTIIGRSETLQNYLIPTPQRVDIQNNEALVWDEYQFSQLSNYLAQFNLSNWETQSFFAGMGGPVIKLSMQQDPKYPSQEYRLLVKNQSVTIIGGSQEAIFYGVQTMRQSDKKRPVVISVPINLRNYFPSATTRNFFGVIKVSYDAAKYDGTLESVIPEIARSFADQLTEEKVAQMLQEAKDEESFEPCCRPDR